MNRFDPKAIAIAFLASLALDVVGGGVLLATFGTGLTEHTTPEQMQEALRVVTQGQGFLLASLAFGSFTTVLGGFVAARLARGYPYFNALAVGLLGIALGLLLPSESPGWFDAFAYLSTLPAALLGGHLARQPRA